MCVGWSKGISNIEYNYLNLPIRITFTGNHKIDFIYDATGKKWRKVINDNGVETYRDYIDGAEYQNGQQDIIHFTEGYTQRDATTDGDANWKGWVYKYTLKDHLGNTRVTYSDRDNNGIVAVSGIEQVNSYYAFGLNMEGSWNGASGAFKFGYNGKEWNDDFGLGWNDYGRRFYDPAISRWAAVDPLAEKFISQNPYNYVMNRPTVMIDPNGMEATFNAKTGELESASGKDAQNYIRGLQNAAKKEEKQKGEARTVNVTVTNESVGKGYLYSYPTAEKKDGKTVSYEVPLYKMTVSGTDDEGKTIEKDYEVVRFGVKMTSKGIPYIQGTPEGTFDNLKWNAEAIKGKGGWQITGNYFIHLGTNRVFDEPAMGNNGCIAVCTVLNSKKGGAFQDMQKLFQQLSGVSDFNEMKINLTVQAADKPELKLQNAEK